MKTTFIFILFCVASFRASSQDIKTRRIVSVPVNDSAKVSNTKLNQRFQDHGNKLLNVNGSLPKHIIGHMPANNDTLKRFTKPGEQLIANTLLFTSDLADYISKPFLRAPEPLKKASAKN